MLKVIESEEKITKAKRTIKLENISVKDLKLIDAETGEDLSQEVMNAIPFDVISFKITFDIPEPTASDEEDV